MERDEGIRMDVGDVVALQVEDLKVAEPGEDRGGQLADPVPVQQEVLQAGQRGERRPVRQGDDPVKDLVLVLFSMLRNV